MRPRCSGDQFVNSERCRVSGEFKLRENGREVVAEEAVGIGHVEPFVSDMTRPARRA